jgi:hypothetical protein
MKIYKYIATVKAKEGKEKMPTHYLKAKENATDKEGEFVASLWAKEWKSPEGQIVKFLSGEMKSQWTDHTDPSKSREGYVIVKERDLNELIKLAGEQDAEVPPDEPQGGSSPF